MSQAVDSVIQERFRTDDAAFSDAELDAVIEALLIVATEPPTIAQLAEALETDMREIRIALERLSALPGRGFVIQRHGDTVQLTSAPRFAAPVRRFLGLERETKLSAAALETLAIVAYRQPVTRSEIEYVRGVDCSGVLSTLLNRNLVENSAAQEGAGRAHLYITTPAFLMHFGMRSLDELPTLGLVNGEDALDQLTMLIADATTDEPGTEAS